MAASYLRRGMTEPATFSLFVRALPPDRGFLVAGGLEACLAYLEGLRFEEADLVWLRDHASFDQRSIDALRTLTFTGDVWAVPEGTVVFAEEPLLEVTAPIAEAQLAETFLLNQVTFATAVASKAARCRLAAGDADLVDFAFRRTQGVEAAMIVARSSAIAGFVATSNVEAARRFDLRAAGTMAHSYVEAFAEEGAAFQAFAEDFPGSAVFLVDTFDTLEGVRRAIEVIRALDLAEGAGIRLDSGDLAALAVQSRRLLDEAGLDRASIFVSGGLDELAIERLRQAGAPIDAFGVGTRMGVSADAPALDTVYKLVAHGHRPVMKLSLDKETAPGAKQVFRHPRFEGDIVGLRDEVPPRNAEPLLEAVMVDGRQTGPPPGWPAARARFEADLERLPASARRLRGPTPVAVELSEAATRLRDEVRARLRPAP